MDHPGFIFFTGGDQLHITSLMGGTELHAAIMERYESGVIVGGTSAGAASPRARTRADS